MQDANRMDSAFYDKKVGGGALMQMHYIVAKPHQVKRGRVGGSGFRMLRMYQFD
jgi:hypothetical protein